MYGNQTTNDRLYAGNHNYKAEERSCCSACVVILTILGILFVAAGIALIIVSLASC